MNLKLEKILHEKYVVVEANIGADLCMHLHQAASCYVAVLGVKLPTLRPR